MKKLVLALTAVAAFTGSAMAADMARPYTKAAAPMAPVVSWTGCYVSGGGGYGIYRVNRDERATVGGAALVVNSTAGGDGWLATVGGGCDYQFNSRWVVGAFADGTWSDIRGDAATRVFGVGDVSVGQLKSDWSWAAGARLGYLVNPSFLTYVNAGYTQAHFKTQSLTTMLAPIASTGIQVPGQSFDGFFIGSGVEYAFDWMPGLFVRSEGRAAWYSRRDVVPVCASAGTFCGGATGAFGDTDSRRPIVYTAKTELVYRFNWGGPVVAKY
jgi:outer membrane immunogenic protein